MLWLLPLLCSLQSISALWPAPSQYTIGNHYVRLDDSFSITTRCSFIVPDDLRAAMRTAEQQIKKDKMQPLEVDLGGIESAARETIFLLHSLALDLTSDTSYGARLPVRNIAMFNTTRRHIASISDDINAAFEQRDESYTLEIALQNSVALLTASTALGLLRGLQTFTQLVYTTSDQQATLYIRDAPLYIEDRPAYPVRGLLLDTARNYYPVKDIKRTLRAMSWAKMN